MNRFIICTGFFACFIKAIEANGGKCSNDWINITSGSGAYEYCHVGGLNIHTCFCKWKFNFTEGDEFITMDFKSKKPFLLDWRRLTEFRRFSGGNFCFNLHNHASRCSTILEKKSQCQRYDISSEVSVRFSTEIPSDGFKMSYKYFKCSRGDISTTISPPSLTSRTTPTKNRNDQNLVIIIATASSAAILLAAAVGVGLYYRKRTIPVATVNANSHVYEEIDPKQTVYSVAYASVQARTGANDQSSSNPAYEHVEDIQPGVEHSGPDQLNVNGPKDGESGDGEDILPEEYPRGEMVENIIYQ